MADTEIKEGDKVSWNWGPSGTNPSGEAKQVKADEVKITSHRGNEIKKKGDESNPAVEVERSGNNVVKLASELEVERDGPKKTNGASEGQGKDEPKTKKDEDEKDDEKKEDDDKDDDDKDNKEEEDKAEKKDDKAEKKDDKSKAEKEDKSSGAASKNGTKSEQSKPQEAKKRGRPAGKASASGASKGEKPKKRAATESGEPRRSKRNKN